MGLRGGALVRGAVGGGGKGLSGGGEVGWGTGKRLKVLCVWLSEYGRGGGSKFPTLLVQLGSDGGGLDRHVGGRGDV